MMRRIIRKLRIDEISGVALPAQKGARAAIFKSAGGPGKEAEMSTNQESLFKMAHGVDFNKVAISDHLDHLAKARARETGESFTAAYNAVLSTATGGELYAAYRRAPEGAAKPAAVEQPPVTKRAAISDAIDALVRQRSAKTGESIPKAYAAILDTAAGKQLYSQMRAA